MKHIHGFPRNKNRRNKSAMFLNDVINWFMSVLGAEKKKKRLFSVATFSDVSDKETFLSELTQFPPHLWRELY